MKYESFIRTIEYKTGRSNIECRKDHHTFEQAIKVLNEDLDIYREGCYAEEALILRQDATGKVYIASVRTIR